jgi:hypothetical protein
MIRLIKMVIYIIRALLVKLPEEDGDPYWCPEE